MCGHQLCSLGGCYRGGCPLLPVSGLLAWALVGSGLAYAWPLPPPQAAALAGEEEGFALHLMKHGRLGVKLCCRVTLLIAGALRD